MVTEKQLEKIQKISDQHAVLDYRRAFTPSEVEKLKTGLAAESMDDKWNSYFYNDTLYLCRSWTGVCIFEISLREIEQGKTVKVARVNRNPNQYNATDDAYDVLLLDFLLSNLILGESKPFPSRGVPGLAQHAVSGTGYRETDASHKPWWKFW